MEINNISLRALAEMGKISVRSRNVCGWNNLNDLLSILNYYGANYSFSNLRKCGQKSNTELIELCKKYDDFTIKPQPVLIFQKTDNSIIQKIDSLTVRQKKNLNNIIESQYRELSIRSSKALNLYLDSQLSIKGLKPILSDENFDIKNLRNIGEKSQKEIRLFLTNIKEQIELISMFENEDELTIELFTSFLATKFFLSPTVLAEIGKGYNFANGLPIFKTLHILIENEIFFDHRDKEIFKKGLKYSTCSNTYRLEDIATEMNVTRERARQVRKQIYDNLHSTFSFVKGLELDALNLYGLDIYSDSIILNDEIISEINEKEQNSFNSLFVNKIFSILLSETFSLVGNEENIVCNRTVRTTHNWNNTYIIRTEFINIFDFEGFVNDVSKRLKERIEETYSFQFEIYLIKFKKDVFLKYSQSIIQIAEHILFSEFAIVLDIYERIMFKRNTIKQVYEYAYEALEELGLPSKVDEIYKKVVDLYPNYNTDENSIRASMKRESGFVPFGRTSVYGLKIWEDAQDIRGGTIRDISEEYLLTQSKPKNIDDITKYVNRYRNTTAKNIYANLRMEENNRFVFYSGLLIGLKAIKYEEVNLTKVEEKQIVRKTWDESFLLLKSFIDENERLPFSSVNLIEERLYRFLNVQLNKAKDGKINEDKNKELLDLISPYVTSNRRKNKKQISPIKIDAFTIQKSADLLKQRQQRVASARWLNSYNELKLFLQKYNEYPKASNDRSLYNFCYLSNKRKNDGSLHESQIEALKEIDFNFSTGNQNSWEDNFSELTNFYTLNRRWPKCIESDSKQMRLYRFCISLFKAYNSNKLSQEQLDRLDNISYPYKRRAFSNVWLYNYEKLKKFRTINPKRWPQARVSEIEKPLYQFCYRNKNKYLNGTLEDYKVKLLNEINFDFYG